MSIGCLLPGRVGDRARYLRSVSQLDSGARPAGLQQQIADLVALADRRLAAGSRTQALYWFDKALRLAYHPTLHYREFSPLAENPDAFLAPFRASTLGRLLLEPPADDGQPSRPPRRARADDDPVRLLVVAQKNWTFVDPVIEALSEHGFDVRRFEVDDLPPAERPSRMHVLRARLDLALDGARLATPGALAEQFDWADVVLVEWGHHVLTWLSLMDRMPRTTAARFHRFEAYTPFPLLTDFSAIDRVLFVSPHVRVLLDRLTPNLASASEILRVDNFLAHDLAHPAEGLHDPFALVQVGWLNPVKDVLFTLDMLEVLRARDERFRLMLVGQSLPEPSDGDTAYQARVRERLSALPAGTVEILGVRDDVPDILAGAGWVVSSSLVEGVHEAVMEGLAAGCVPVIRDWPGAREYGGARGIYADDWIVDDAEAGARRILDVTESGTFPELSRESRVWVMERRTPEIVERGYAEALRPADAR